MELTMAVLREQPVPQGSLAVWWLGQASFLIKSPGGVLVALDP
jgi:L-ascorbate 6-phosphate lactonase